MNIIAVLTLILIGTTSIALKVMKNENSKLKAIVKVNSTSTKWMLIAYVVILVGFTITAAFISPAEPRYEKANAEDIEQFTEIYTKLSEGDDEEIPAKFIAETWSETVPNNIFKIINENPSWLPISIFVERGETAEGKVEATLYKGYHVINEYMVRDYMDDIGLAWGEGQLTIKGLENEAISMTFFQHDFIFGQLEEERFTPSNQMSEQYPILYLKVPDSIELVADEWTVQIVES